MRVERDEIDLVGYGKVPNLDYYKRISEGLRELRIYTGTGTDMLV
jgi:hypothetical protein